MLGRTKWSEIQGEMFQWLDFKSRSKQPAQFPNTRFQYSHKKKKALIDWTKMLYFQTKKQLSGRGKGFPFI